MVMHRLMLGRRARLKQVVAIAAVLCELARSEEGGRTRLRAREGMDVCVRVRTLSGGQVAPG
jgi:hypothetical protein